MMLQPMGVKTICYANKEITLKGLLGDPYFENIESHVARSEFLVPLLAHHVSAGSTIIDVGANIGVTTCLAKSLT